MLLSGSLSRLYKLDRSDLMSEADLIDRFVIDDRGISGD